MELHNCGGKNVKITLNTGQVFQGVAYDYTSAQDNEPEIASITIDGIELYENQIINIELI